MPLVSAGVWFGDDPGDSRPIVRAPRRLADGYGDSTRATLIPGPLPTGAPCWDVYQRGRPQPRPWQPSTTTQDSFPWPTLAGIGQRLDWQGHDRYQPRPLRRLPPEQPGLVLTPAGVLADQLVSWLGVGTDRSRAQSRLFKAADLLDVVPIWTGGTGQPVPPLAWLGDDGRLIVRGRSRPLVVAETGLPPLLGITDVAVTLIGWRADETAARWRRASWRAGEVGEVPLAAVLTLAGFWGPERQLSEGARRPAVWRAGVEPPSVLVSPLIDPAPWLAALPGLAPSRRLVPPARGAAVEDSAALAWLASEATKGRGWGAWETQTLTLVRARRLSLAEAAGLVLDTSQMAVSLFLPPGGDLPRRRRPPWSISEPWAAPPWLGAGLVVVPGPFYLVAGQLYVAGAVEGSVRSAS